MIKSNWVRTLCLTASVLSLSVCVNHDQNKADASETLVQHKLLENKSDINTNQSKPEINLSVVSDWLNSIDNSS